MGKPALFDKEDRKEADIIRLEPVNHRQNSNEKHDRSFSKLEDENFGWLSAFDTENMPPVKPGSKTAETNSYSGLDAGGSLFDQRHDRGSDKRHASGDDDAEGMRRELHRRLQNETRDHINQPTFRDEASSSGLALSEPRQSLMSALLPYVAAACFFAFIAGGAVFYFVAVQSRDERAANFSQSAQEPRRFRDDFTNDPGSFSTRGSGAKQSQDSAVVTPSASVQSQPSFSSQPNALRSVDNKAAAVSGASASAMAPDALSARPNSDTSTPVAPTEDKKLPDQPLPSLAGLQNNRLSAPAPDATRFESAALSTRQSEASVKPDQTTSVSSKTEASMAQVANPASTAITPPATTERSRLLISPEEEREILTRGRETLQEGDVAGARLLLQYLADQGSAPGAYLMGQTFDPAVLSTIGVRGLKGDTKSAKIWYEKAAAMGNRDAVTRLGQLGQ